MSMDQTSVTLDSTDLALLRELQNDASVSMEHLASLVGVSKTAPKLVGLPETFFIAVKTNKHEDGWLKRFDTAMHKYPEIVEVHRLAGDVDYLIKVQVASTREFDRLYKAIVSDVELYSVTSSLSMEVLKYETTLPI